MASSDPAERPLSGWKFGAMWTGFSVAGWIIGYLVTFVVFMSIARQFVSGSDYEIEESDIGILLLFALFGIGGAGFGLPQWWLLRNRVTQSKWWIGAMSIGFLSTLIASGILLSVGFSDTDSDTIAFNAVVYAIGGLVVGFIQSRLVTPTIPARVWILTCGIAFGVAGAFNIIIKRAGGGDDSIGEFAAISLIALVLGLAIAWWLEPEEIEDAPDATAA